MPATPAITVVAAIIRGADGRICLSKRPDHKHQGGRWEFPGGKVESGESLADALARELVEELGMAEALSCPFMTIAHQYQDLHVTLHFRDVTTWQGEPEGREGQQVAWFACDELASLDFPAANQPVVTAITLPACLVIPPADISLEGLLAGIQQLDPRQQGLYLRDWSDSPECSAILAQCQRQGVKVWLRARSAGIVEEGCFALHLPEAVLMACDQRPAFKGVVSAACHSEAALNKAVALGLDMALVSPVQATASHPERTPLGWSAFSSLVEGLPLACYGLGGLTPQDLPEARARGAVGVAGIRAFWPE